MSARASRRQFLQSSTSAALVGALATEAAFSRFAHAKANDDVLRVGLVGCGGRGSGAASNALEADPNTRLVAMGDAFADRLEGSLARFKADPNLAPRVDVPAERQFVGFDAYKQVIECSDVVLLCTPPHFRPAQFKAAVAANKHCFVEKPVAVDGPGVRSVLATAEEAKKKNLSVVSGLCWRYDEGVRATMGQIHNGAIGDITAMQCTYDTGLLWKWDRKEGWSDMEYQLRNWLYYTWLSGDHNNEQHIHSLDKMGWAMKDEYPVSAMGVGGRQQRTAEVYGNIYDHFSITYEFANGVRAFSQCRQMGDCATDVSDHLFGTKGKCDIMKNIIKGETNFRFSGKKGNMYVDEHRALFESIRQSKPINNGEYMAKSTLMAIMGRMAAYTGQKVTWDQALNSQEVLGPTKYEWGTLPTPPVAIPGGKVT
jgi:predicted dehydrogenase